MTTIAVTDFVEFPSIARLSREMIVTEKIDGTNAQVFVGEDGAVRAGSRNRWIVPEADNFGFAGWVRDHADELRDGLGVGRHFGEWWGSGIQRGYGLPKGEKRFSLFNVSRWADDRDTVKYPNPRPACCHVVPVLRAGVFDTAVIESALTLLGTAGSVASPGFMQPEGIVVFHLAGNVGFKKTLDKNDGHKGAGR